MRNVRKQAFAAVLLPALLSTLSAGVPADDDAAAEPPIFERVRVLGDPVDAESIPGSVAWIGPQQLERRDSGDVNRVLAQIPGMLLQEEDGHGLRPNIGMRGTGVERSSKITLMEDGVLIAPAPYAAPSAYYFPTIARMDGIEVRKGSASIRQGPYTIGGVVNMVSASIPSDFEGRAELRVGDDATVRARVRAGDSDERFGWVVEGLRESTDGFKTLDGGGDSGYRLDDFMAKFRFTSGAAARRYQAFELKLGTTEQDGDETYLGLTEADFAMTPFRRYAASQQDRIRSDHDQVQARYMVRPNEIVDLTATLYRNEFFRNWRKLEKVNGLSVGSVLDDPLGFAAELDVLRADLAADSADDALSVRNNRRDYFSNGLHAVVGVRPSSSYEFEFGLRLHEDEEDRFQEEDGFRMTSAGLMQPTSLGVPGSQANRVADARAVAGFAQAELRVGRWQITPGIRFESIDYRRIDYADAARTTIASRRDNDVTEWIPGIGASFELHHGARLFASVHRGFSPPGPGAGASQSEESVNYEAGWRMRRASSRVELVGFFNDYENLLGECTIFSGCSSADIGDVFDGGRTRVRGVELSGGFDLGRALGLSVSVPIDATYTRTESEFLTSFESDYDAWGSVERGFELPYLPQDHATLSGGVVDERFSVFAFVNFVDEMRTEAGAGPIAPGTGTDDAVVVDLSGSWRLGSKLRIVGNVKNLTDRAYVVARRPAGLRPAIDRGVTIGLRYDF